MTDGGQRVKGWGWVVLGGLFEIGFTTFLKLQQDDPRFGLAFILCAVVSFECLAEGIKTLPLGLAYAVWTGIGSVGAIAVGILAFDDPAGPLRLALVTALVAAMVSLKLVSDADHATGRGRPPRPTGR